MFVTLNKKAAHTILAVSIFFAMLLLGFFVVLNYGFSNARIYKSEKEAVSAMSSDTKIKWGLSFQDGSSEPVPNCTAQELAEYNSYYIDTRAHNTLYLTFDSGYENGNVPKILDALKKHNVKATFFVASNYVKENPELIKRMVEEGHTVGNHTHSHPDMALKSKEAFVEQLLLLEREFYTLTGAEMGKFYRPPEGSFTKENLKWASELGYKTIFWSLAYVDWEVDNQPSKEYAFEKLLPRTHSGAIILLHSSSKTNADILDELIQKWVQEGYTFGTLAQIGGA